MAESTCRMSACSRMLESCQDWLVEAASTPSWLLRGATALPWTRNSKTKPWLVRANNGMKFFSVGKCQLEVGDALVWPKRSRRQGKALSVCAVGFKAQLQRGLILTYLLCLCAGQLLIQAAVGHPSTANALHFNPRHEDLEFFQEACQRAGCWREQICAV